MIEVEGVEWVEVDGKHTRAIFDPGTKVKKVVRGTELSITKPFLILESEVKKGAEIKRQGKTYYADSIEVSACSFYTVFLGESRGSGPNYINKTSDA